MAELFYIPTEPPAVPFVKGDTVEVVGRDGRSLSSVTVVRVNARTVKTSCKREWTKDGEWWDGSRAYPFPSIRKAAYGVLGTVKEHQR